MAFLSQGASEDDIMEERKELMVSPTDGIQQTRIAHFLKPTVPYFKAPHFKLPHLSPKSMWPLHVEFNGWRDPQKNWEFWVEKMKAKNQSLWEKAGIFEAIMCSKYRFHRNDDLVFGMAERWCCETNTFVLPWGEATITLEDVMILGGFSILGSPVLMPLAEKELVEIEKRLKNVHQKFVKMKRHDHLQWLKFYMESEKRYEHEAFLSLWLSRFVFPGNEVDQIGEHVFPIAVYLARGIRLAIAPAVLACIYRDLSLLKESIAASSNLEDESGESSILALSLWAPLQLIQPWAWERFMMFRPEPNFLSFGDPRAARWHDVKKSDIGNVRPIIHSSGEIFLWRPYTLSVDQWAFPILYRELEDWVQIGECPDEALESFARCLRACVLIGIDCEEPYQPHRVAMQFGLDQDIPALVPRSIESIEVAWISYSKPLDKDTRLYIPARLFESDLSIQYQQWWRKTVLVLVDSFQGVVRRQRSSVIQHRELRTSKQTGGEGFAGRSNTPVPGGRASMEKQINMHGNDSDVPPGFHPKCNQILNARLENSTKKQNKRDRNDAVVPSGFSPKRNHTPNARVETSFKKQNKEEGNDADVPPGFPPKGNYTPNARIETSVQKQNKGLGNDADVPSGFPAKHKHAVMTRPETSTKQQNKGEGNDADVPPGFLPRRSHIPNVRVETSTKKQNKREGNDADIPPVLLPLNKRACMTRPDTSSKKHTQGEGEVLVVPPGFSSKNKHAPMMKPETSIKKQIKKGNGVDLPPECPPEITHAPNLSTETSTKLQTKVQGNDAAVPPVVRTESYSKQQMKTNAFDLNIPPSFPSEPNQCPPVVPDTSTNQQKQVQNFDLNLPPIFSPGFTSTLEQSQSLERLLQPCNNHSSSKDTLAHEMNPPSASKAEVQSSSAAAMGISGSVQLSQCPTGRTINTSNAASTGHAYKSKDGNSVDNLSTISESGGQNNCSFKFSSQILANMQVGMKRIKSQVSGPQGN